MRSRRCTGNTPSPARNSLIPGLAAGEVRSVRLEAAMEGLPVAFVVRRVEAASSFVVSTVEVRESCPLPRKIELPRHDEAALLCGALQEPARDPLFDAALDAAARIVGSSR